METPAEVVHILGVDPEDGKPYGVYASDRIHTAVFGYPGTGKSRLLLYMALDHLKRDEGVMIMDPHGDLARLFLSHVPEDKWDRLVYIDPTTAAKYGRVVQINFLECKDPKYKDMVARVFMDSLEKVYARYWGPRLDMIMLNALYLMLDAGRTRLPEIYNVIADSSFREDLLNQTKDEKVRSFWMSEFQRMPKDASSGALTKIYRIVQERMAAPMFDCETSTIDFRSLMDNGNIVVVNLSEGAITSDLANFIGSLILARVYLAGMSRENMPEEQRRPFYVYIDEAARFTSSSIQDILQSLRKYRVYLTLASQYLEQYRIDVQRSIPSLCDTILCFRVGENTAKAIEQYYHPVFNRQDLCMLPNYHFAATALVRGRREWMLFKTVDRGVGPHDVEKVIKRSLERHGREVDMSKYTGAPTSMEDVKCDFRPAEWQVMLRLYEHYREKVGVGMATLDSIPHVERESLIEELSNPKMHKSPWLVPESDVKEAIHSLSNKLGMIHIKDEEVRWTGVALPDPPYRPNASCCAICGEETNWYYVLREQATGNRFLYCRRCAEEAVYRDRRIVDKFVDPEIPAAPTQPMHRSRRIQRIGIHRSAVTQYFEITPMGQRGGGDVHVMLISWLVKREWESGNYCQVDLGVETPTKKPDGKVEYMVRKQKGGEIVYGVKKLPDVLVLPVIQSEGKIDPRYWNTHIYAYEVEIYPSKHKGRVLSNYQKNLAAGRPTIFVTDKPEEARAIVRILKDNDVKVVENCIDPYNPAAATVWFVNINAKTQLPDTQIPVTSPTQPLTPEEQEKGESAVHTPEPTETPVEEEEKKAEEAPKPGEEPKPKEQPKEVKVELHVTSATKGSLIGMLSLFSREPWRLVHRLSDGKLVAQAKVGTEVYEQVLADYDADTVQALEQLHLKDRVVVVQPKEKLQPKGEQPKGEERPEAEKPAQRVEAVQKPVEERKEEVGVSAEAEAAEERELRMKIEAYLREGYRPRIKKKGEARYLTLYKWDKGKQSEFSLGRIDDACYNVIKRMKLFEKGDA